MGNRRSTKRVLALVAAGLGLGVLSLGIGSDSAQARFASVFQSPTPAYSDGFFDLKVIEERTAEELAQLGITEEQVGEITYYVQKRNQSRGDDDAIVGAEAIVRLDTCDMGFLALSFSSSGYFRQAYTRFGCEVAGVTAY